MGFEQIATLTHEMEDVFELLRQRERALSREAVDTVLACLDALGGAVASIESVGTEELDPAELITRLRSLVCARARRAGDRARRAAGSSLTWSALLGDGIRVLHVRAVLSDAVLMPAVRAHMVLAALAEHGEHARLGARRPTASSSSTATSIEAWLACEHEQEEILATVGGISDVISVEVDELARLLPPTRRPRSSPQPPPRTSRRPPQGPSMRPEAALRARSRPPSMPPPRPLLQPRPPRRARPRPPDPRPVAHARCASTPSGWTRSCTRWASSSSTAPHVEAIASRLDVPDLHQAMQELTRSSQALQAMVMQVRMIPVDVVFLRFPRLVRDLSTKLGKEVRARADRLRDRA